MLCSRSWVAFSGDIRPHRELILLVYKANDKMVECTGPWPSAQNPTPSETCLNSISVSSCPLQVFEAVDLEGPLALFPLEEGLVAFVHVYGTSRALLVLLLLECASR